MCLHESDSSVASCAARLRAWNPVSDISAHRPRMLGDPGAVAERCRRRRNRPSRGTLSQPLGGDARYHSVTSLVRREVPAPPGVAVHRADFERLDELVLRRRRTMRSVASGPRGEPRGLLLRSDASTSTTSLLCLQLAKRAGHSALCWCLRWAPHRALPFSIPARKENVKPRSRRLDSRR